MTTTPDTPPTEKHPALPLLEEIQYPLCSVCGKTLDHKRNPDSDDASVAAIPAWGKRARLVRAAAPELRER